jgi:hypothetical protein
MHIYTLNPKCRKGGYSKGLALGEYTRDQPGREGESLPERTDPMYLSWKQLLRQHHIADRFERTWGGMMEPAQWAKFQAEYISSSDFRQWAEEVIRPGGFARSAISRFAANARAAGQGCRRPP